MRIQEIIAQIIQWLNDNNGILDLAISLLSMFAAIAAAIAAGRANHYSKKQENRAVKRINYSIDKVATPLAGLFTVKQDLSQISDPFILHYNQLIKVFIINPSLTPVSIFNIRVTDPTDDQCEYLFPREHHIRQQQLPNIFYAVPKRIDNAASMEMDGYTFVAPPDSYACLTGNSCLEMMLAIGARKGTKVLVSFQICKKKEPNVFLKISSLFKMPKKKTDDFFNEYILVKQEVDIRYNSPFTHAEAHEQFLADANMMLNYTGYDDNVTNNNVVHIVAIDKQALCSRNNDDEKFKKTAPPEDDADETETITPAARPNGYIENNKAQTLFNEAIDPENPPEF